MDKNVVFMFVTPALRNDDIKFLMRKLKSLCNVEVVDVSPVLAPDVDAAIEQSRFNSDGIRYYRMITKREIEIFIREKSKNSFFLPIFNCYYTVRYIYHLFTKYKVRYGYVNNLESDFELNIDVKPTMSVSQRLTYSHCKAAFYNRIVRKIIKYRPAEFIALGTKSSGENYFRLGVCDNTTKKLYTHTFDYERFMNISGYDNAGKQYCVFLDQYIPYHPDNILDRGIRIEADMYYLELEDILDEIQRDTGLDVIIAAHPRADYKNKKKFQNYKIEYGKSAELIKGANLVVGHFSTVLGMVAMAKVPLGIVMTPSITKIQAFSDVCHSYVEILGGEPIMSTKDVKNLHLEINEKKYSEFAEKYMTSGQNDDRSLWNVIMENINI